MKVCLLAIAKNEDHYIQEWVNYYLRLNFDDICIIQDNWKAPIESNPKVHLLDGYMDENKSVDGDKQETYYAEFVKLNNKNYDWIAIFDVDEFLYIKDCKNIHEFLQPRYDLPSIGCHWRMFGDNNIKKVSNNYSVIQRFTRSQKECSNTFKSIYNMNKLRCMFGQDVLDKQSIISVHTFKDITVNDIKLYDIQYGYNFERISIDYNQSNKHELSLATDNFYLAHYKKTYPEFLQRYQNTNAIWWVRYKKSMNNDMKKVYENMNPSYFNEVENYDLLNFVKGN